MILERLAREGQMDPGAGLDEDPGQGVLRLDTARGSLPRAAARNVKRLSDLLGGGADLDVEPMGHTCSA